VKIVEPRRWLAMDHVHILRAGGKAGFAFPFAVAEYPQPQYWVRFTDDAGLHWQIDPDLHLEKLANRDDW